MAFGCTEGPGSSESWVVFAWTGIDSFAARVLLARILVVVLGVTCSLADSEKQVHDEKDVSNLQRMHVMTKYSSTAYLLF